MRAHRLRFRLALSADAYLDYYRGNAQQIITEAETRQRIRFPAEALRPYVTHDGVYGYFEIEFDDQHKLVRLVRIGD